MSKEVTSFEELIERRHIGQLMSNVLFNLEQQSKLLDAHTCAQLNELRTRWDAILKYDTSYELVRQDASKAALLNLMRNISEENYCAGWLNGLEKDLWGYAFLGYTSDSFALASVRPIDIEHLRVLARATDSWWIWDDTLIKNICITFAEASKMFGAPLVMVCNCPIPNEYTLPSYNCPVHQNIGRQK